VSRPLISVLFALAVLLAEASDARAQEAEAVGSADAPATSGGDEGSAEEAPDEDGPVTEEIDVTRLDVERLPPEAIEITRDLYSHGFFIEGWIGGRGFVGGVGDISSPGLFANVGLGLEIFRFLYLKLAFEGSIHETDAPPPPSPTVFELLSALVELKLQINVSTRVALWLQGEFGGSLAFGDILPIYGIQGADEVGLMYGGSAGFDWHLYNRHYSVGFLGGARVFAGLETVTGDISLGIHGALYLRYVF
jgi:hypothetical protein